MKAWLVSISLLLLGAAAGAFLNQAVRDHSNVVIGQYGGSYHNFLQVSLVRQAKGGPGNPIGLLHVKPTGLNLELDDIFRLNPRSKREAALVRLGESIDFEDMAASLKVLAKRPEWEARETLAQLLLARWAKSESKAALLYARGLPRSKARFLALTKVVEGWTEVDKSGAMSWLNELPNGPEKEQLFKVSIITLATLNPSQALDILNSLKAPGASTELQAGLLRQWAEQDPAAAAAAASSLKVENNACLGEIARNWAMKDPARAMAWVKGLPGDSPGPEIARDLCDSLVYSNPKLASEFAMSLGPGRAQDAAVASIAAGISGSDLTAAISWVQQITNSSAKAAALQRMVDEWSQSEPQATAALALTLDPGISRSDIFKTVPGAWMTNDPALAAAWAQSMPVGPNRNQAMQQIVKTWADADPSAAASFVMSQTPGNLQTSLATALITQWGSSDPESAASWAIANLQGRSQSEAVSALAVGWSHQSPLNAANFAAGLQPGDTQSAVVSSVLTSWASTDPASAASWVTQFPDGKLRDQSLQDVAIGWAVKDPTAAGNWLQGLSPGADRDTAVGAFVGVVQSVDPAAAAAWASSIGDDQQKLFRIESTARAWMEVDEAAARVWVQNSALPDAAKKQLLGTP